MKNLLFAYTFLILYGVSLVKPIAPFLDYAINYDYIANVLCINKDKPALKCNGKCHLKKELKEAGNTKEESSKSIVTSVEKYHFETIKKVCFIKVFRDSKQFYYLKNKTISFLTPVFRPPIV